MALIKSLSWGAAAFVLMMAVYFGVVGLVSGWDFTLEQFAKFWQYIIALALGFGVLLILTSLAVTSPQENLFVRSQIAFYASTPSYRAVMSLHGWDEIAERLSGLAARGEWSEMPGLISDEMLQTFAVVADPADLPAALSERYQGVADHLAQNDEHALQMHLDHACEGQRERHRQHGRAHDPEACHAVCQP